MRRCVGRASTHACAGWLAGCASPTCLSDATTARSGPLASRGCDDRCGDGITTPSCAVSRKAYVQVLDWAPLAGALSLSCASQGAQRPPPVLDPCMHRQRWRTPTCVSLTTAFLRNAQDVLVRAMDSPLGGAEPSMPAKGPSLHCWCVLGKDRRIPCSEFPHGCATSLDDRGRWRRRARMIAKNAGNVVAILIIDSRSSADTNLAHFSVMWCVPGARYSGGQNTNKPPLDPH